VTSLATDLTGSDLAAAFVRRHQRGLWRWLLALGCEAAAAEEHCQDALLAALQHGIGALPEAEARRWLRHAARNLVRMAWRAQQRRPAIVPLGQIEAIEAAWLAVHGDDDGGDAAAEALARCLDGLPARDREFVRQRYEVGLSRAAMAAAAGVGEAAIKQVLRRVRACLRACVEQRLHEENGDGR